MINASYKRALTPVSKYGICLSYVLEMEGGWERALRGKRRKCSAFEMMFKKNLLDANNVEQKKKRIFKLGDFRKDAQRDDDTVVDIAAYRFLFSYFSGFAILHIAILEFIWACPLS